MTTDKSEVLHNSISTAQQQLKEDGYCVIADVLDPEHTQDVLKKLWIAAEENKRQGSALHLPDLDPNDKNVRVFYLLERDSVFRELIQHQVAIETVKSVLGQNILVSNFTANIARPGSGSMKLHSDQSLVVPEPWTTSWALNIIWCLTDVYFENGATLYIPGSHRWQRRADVPHDVETQLKPFVAKAGSIVAMDGRTWHTSGSNVTKDQDRALLFGYYTVPFLRQQVNWTAALSSDTKATLSNDMRELLGVNITANTGTVSDVGTGLDKYEIKSTKSLSQCLQIPSLSWNPRVRRISIQVIATIESHFSMLDHHEHLVRAVCQGLEKCSPDDVEPAAKFFTPDVVFHMWGPHNAPLVGIEALRLGFKDTFISVKDFQVEILTIASHANTVFVERVERMRYNGEHPVTLHMIGVIELSSDGKIKSWKDYFDPTEIKRLE
ncbi:hypothetical protein B7463_g7913, partial [Scytalidium lignicola]